MRGDILFVLGVLMTGCIPLHVRVREAGAVKVIDAETKIPVSGARVTVETWQVRTPSGEKFRKLDTYQTVTDGDGRFSIPSKKKWAMVMPVPDGAPSYHMRVCIEKSEYEQFEMDPWKENPMDPWAVQLKEEYSLIPSSNVTGD